MLNPSNMNLGQLLVGGSITPILPRIHFTPPIQHSHLPTSPTHANDATKLPFAESDSLIIIIVKHVSSKYSYNLNMPLGIYCPSKQYISPNNESIDNLLLSLTTNTGLLDSLGVHRDQLGHHCDLSAP